ncbi:MAG: hypothetical protein H6683_08600 [Deltaproteobacteria bacterium]|nr:hypothetical protein [Deltaproteobacteria bacterium]
MSCASGDDDDASEPYECLDFDEPSDDLPNCEELFGDVQPWFETSNIKGTYGDYERLAAEKGGVLEMRVADVRGDRIDLATDGYTVRLLIENTTIVPPVEKDQLIQLVRSESVGDDGCCDTSSFEIFHLDGRLLLANYISQEQPRFRLEGLTAVTFFQDRVCAYERSADSRYPNWRRGMSVHGVIGDSAFTVPAPGESTTTDDGKYTVNWESAREGESCDEEGRAWWSRSWILEAIAVNGEEPDESSISSAMAGTTIVDR